MTPLFIELTQVCGTPALVNLAHVVCLRIMGGNVRVFLSTGADVYLDVRESYASLCFLVGQYIQQNSSSASVETCPDCQGRGFNYVDWNNPHQTCHTCYGSGNRVSPSTPEDPAYLTY
jgi:DnaJ-class molecular chaperone